MSWRIFICYGIIAITLLMSQKINAQTFPTTGPSTSIPDEFTDPETHLRIVHLSRFPNARSGVIYFTYPCITQDSRYALIDTQFEDKWRHLYRFDFHDLSVQPLVVDRLTQDQVISARSGNLYYLADNAAWVMNINTGGGKRKIADIPFKWVPGAGFSVNADETLIACASPDVEVSPAKPGDKLPSGAQTFAQHLPNVVFTINIKTGVAKVVHRINTWIGHVQFSPTDPDLLMFCHEGPWEQVDRIWLKRMSKPDPYLFYKRTEPREIAGHEFWAPDGQTVWFQQTFRDRKTSFLLGKSITTGKLTQYPFPRGTESIHDTITPDGKYFLADGIGKTKRGPNKYLSLLIPRGDHLDPLHLCSLQNNDYTIEPNPHASPDNRWVIFTATLFGTPQAYGVEIPPTLLK